MPTTQFRSLKHFKTRIKSFGSQLRSANLYAFIFLKLLKIPENIMIIYIQLTSQVLEKDMTGQKFFFTDFKNRKKLSCFAYIFCLLSQNIYEPINNDQWIPELFRIFTKNLFLQVQFFRFCLNLVRFHTFYHKKLSI